MRCPTGKSNLGLIDVDYKMRSNHFALTRSLGFDEDGLYDSVETDISAYSETITEMLGTPVLNLNPDEEESIPGRKDASIVRGFLSELETKVINLGILKRAEIISKKLTFSKKADIYYRLKRLINENLMGKLFKVMLATNKNVIFKTGFKN